MNEKCNKKVKKVAQIFFCETCDYKTSRCGDFSKHLETQKHKCNNFVTDLSQVSNLTCDNCLKVFNNRTSLWRHNKICIPTYKQEDYIIQLINQNSELHKLIIELSKDKNVKNITNNTNNNQHFNLNFFLNETCKDAMNIEDFVSSIKVNIEDLEHTGINGYVEGISNIFIKNLNSLENHLRPLHCSDAKREIIYIKNNNEWIKEKDDKPILTNAIKNIARENIKQISLWKEQNPGCTLSDSKKNNTYLKILSNSMCGINEYETNNNIHKIISNLSKETYINKSKL